MKTAYRLKCSPPAYEATITGKKTHEIRSTVDCEYAEGDRLCLREYSFEEKKFSGREAVVVVTYVSLVDEIEACVMSIRLETTDDVAREMIDAVKEKMFEPPVMPQDGVNPSITSVYAANPYGVVSMPVYAAVSPHGVIAWTSASTAESPPLSTPVQFLSLDLTEQPLEVTCAVTAPSPFPEHLVKRFGEDTIEHDFSLENDPLYRDMMLAIRERDEVRQDTVHKGEHLLNVSTPAQVQHLVKKIINAFHAGYLGDDGLVTFIELFGKCKTTTLEIQKCLLDEALAQENEVATLAAFRAVNNWYDGVKINDELVNIIKTRVDTSMCDYDTLNRFLIENT